MNARWKRVGFVGFGLIVAGVAGAGQLEPGAGGTKGSGTVSVVDALARPGELPFGEPTRLEDVVSILSERLQAPVVLDRAALVRRGLTVEDTVQLRLEGVRLKTSLQLLLDQVGLTYRVVPEDNLLIVTDDEGADDPCRRVMAELEVMHRELHELRDVVEAVWERVAAGEGESGVRHPTMIEEVEPDGVDAPRPREGGVEERPAGRLRPRRTVWREAER